MATDCRDTSHYARSPDIQLTHLFHSNFIFFFIPKYFLFLWHIIIKKFLPLKVNKELIYFSLYFHHQYSCIEKKMERKEKSYKFFYVSTHSNVDICEKAIVLLHVWDGVRMVEGERRKGQCCGI